MNQKNKPQVSGTGKGLTSQQVQERVLRGDVNKYAGNTTKSYGQILKEHFFTFFNILNIVLAALLFAVGAYKDMTFVVIVLTNFLIGIIQEISSKRTLDQLALIVAARAHVVRDGVLQKIHVCDLVIDDVMELLAGRQICADASIISGYLEVNESLITGESDVVIKRAGDYLYSGSFVVSGNACAQVLHVGEQNYANQISNSAKAPRRRHSELYSTLNNILRAISYVIVPLGVLLFYKQHLVLGILADEAVVKTVAGIIGMIPEGLILATSISFMASVIFLGKDNTLVQDMYGIETFARADVMCLDKTGTLTEGRLRFDSLVPLKGHTAEEVAHVLSNFTAATTDENATIRSLKEQFEPAEDYTVLQRMPFSSDRKWSGIHFSDVGSYVLGATEFVLPENDKCKQQAEKLSDTGKRVLVIAHGRTAPEAENTLPKDLRPLAFVLLADQVREDAKETLAYFYEYDMDVKIISGDNPKTVSYIAEQAGVENARLYVDASTLHTDKELRHAVLNFSVFGRVSPEQKKQMVTIMQQEGLKVSMMGDGVNDVLALKEADCSVAVASGSDAAKNISDIVLMDSGLIHLLHVLEDGRKIINNTQRVATLFITKAVYSCILALATLLLFSWAYPFTPLQIAFTSFVTIGAPTFFLALEPQYDRIHGNFVRNVLKKSLPGGLCVAFCVMLVTFFGNVLHCTPNQLTTICVFLVTAGGMWVLLKASRPLTRLRKWVIAGVLSFFVVCVILFPNFLEIVPLSPLQMVITLLMGALMPAVMWMMEKLMEMVYKLLDRWKHKGSKETVEAQQTRHEAKTR